MFRNVVLCLLREIEIAWRKSGSRLFLSQRNNNHTVSERSVNALCSKRLTNCPIASKTRMSDESKGPTKPNLCNALTHPAGLTTSFSSEHNMENILALCSCPSPGLQKKVVETTLGLVGFKGSPANEGKVATCAHKTPSLSKFNPERRRTPRTGRTNDGGELDA